MIPQNAAYAYIGALVEELVRAGVRHLCLCPGSRSTPLAMCAARQPGLKVWTLIDERSAAFFALGLAKARRSPVAVLSTSGTAAANFLPAVVEAKYGRVPLVVLTADRPHELRGAGANQTIDQIRLYGPHAKWFVDVALPEASAALLRYARTIAAQAVALTADAPAGPIHLNFPLREPLVPTPAFDHEFEQAVGMEPAEIAAWKGRGTGKPYARAPRVQRAPGAALAEALARDLARTQRGIIVCGPYDDPALPDAVSRLARGLGYPILADPLSQVRCGLHDRRLVIDSYDPLLRIGRWAASLEPQVVVRFGAVPASKPLAQYLQLHSRARQIVVDGGAEWLDPGRLASDFIHADPVLLCEAMVAARGGTQAGAPALSGHASSSTWAALWQRLGAQTRGALQRHLGMVDEPFEGKVFAELARILPDRSILYVGNSMPVRDLDSFFPGVDTAIRILGNRGASGIDGLISSGLGAAAADAGPVVLVLGDLAFYHDMNGLLAAKLHQLKATIVLLNNDGGGIFSFLPQVAFPEHFEALFGTPHGLNFRHAADLYDAAYVRADAWDAFRAQVEAGLASGGLTIVEMRTGRERNVALHREMWAAVEAALRDEVLALAADDG